MALDCTVIKITHPQIDEAKFDGNFGWVDKKDQIDYTIQGLMEHHGIESREDFELDTYKIESEKIMSIIESREPDF